MRQYLKDLRINKGITQTELSEALGVTQNYYSLIESGKRMKKIDLLLLDKLATFYNVSINWLLDEEMKVIKGA